MDPSDEHVTEVELSPAGSPPSRSWGHRHGAMAVAALVAGAVLISGASGGGHALSTSELADFAGPELPEDRDAGRRRVIVWEEYGPDDTTERDLYVTSDEMAIEIDEPTSTLDPLLVDPWVPPEYDDTFPPQDEEWDGPSYTIPPRRTTPPRATTPPRSTTPPRRTTTTASTTTTTTTSTTTSTSTTTTILAPGTVTSSSSSTTTSTVVVPPGLPSTTTTTIPFCHETTTTSTTTTTLPLGITIPPIVLPDMLTTTTTTPPCITTTTTTTTTTTPP